MNSFIVKMYLIVVFIISLTIGSDSLYCTINKNKAVICDEDLNSIKQNDSSTIAWAFYQNNINITGWANLEVHTNVNYTDSEQAYYAGYLEGELTYDLIGMHWRTKLQNFCSNTSFCSKFDSFLKENEKFTTIMIKKYANEDPYWHQISLIYKQIQGLQDGHDFKNKSKINNPNLFVMSLRTELDEIEEAINSAQHRIGHGSCSAFIKPLADGSDLFVSHNTWGGFSSMLRVVKKYVFNFHDSPNSNSNLITGHTVGFSSFPGVVFSIDDFYIISSGLVVQETTIENFNKSLWSYVRPENIVLEFMRNIVANRLAKSGKEWTDIFGRHNSGTYNNQFMIIDYNKFKIGTKITELSDNLIWIIEQLPGIISAADVTEIVRKQGYWASYNVPYFEDISISSGYPEMVHKYGDYFSWNDTARAQIFRRDHQKVSDIKSVYKLMRYNDYKNDPFSRCNCSPPYSAMLAIAARGDLNDPNGIYPFKQLGLKAQAAIDVKLTNIEMMKNFEMIAVSGPTYDQQIPFQWSMSRFKNSIHEGQPDRWAFPPIHVKWWPQKWSIFNHSITAFV